MLKRDPEPSGNGVIAINYVWVRFSVEVQWSNGQKGIHGTMKVSEMFENYSGGSLV